MLCMNKTNKFGTFCIDYQKDSFLKDEQKYEFPYYPLNEWYVEIC